MKQNLPKSLIKLSSACNDACGKLFIVGGFVRNNLLGLDAKDIDICSSHSPKNIAKIASELGFSTKITNKKLGTVSIFADEHVFEHTTFRVDSYPKNSGVHLPEKVQFITDIKTDAKRRDFTINAIYYDIYNDCYLDFFDGLKHLKKKTLITVNNQVFKHDGLRLLRLIRFSCELGFSIHPYTLKQALSNRHYLKDISKERILAEIKQIVVADIKYNLTAKAKNKDFLHLFNKLQVLKYTHPTLNFVIKNKAFDFYALPKDYRYMAFCMILLASYFNYQPTTHDQVMFVCHKIFGKQALRESNRQLADIFACYKIFQISFYNLPHTLEQVISFANTNEFVKKVLTSIVPKTVNALTAEINNFEKNNIPLNKNQLAVSNVELLTIANIENKYISKVKEALFNLCLQGKVKNEKNQLIEQAQSFFK